MRIKVNPHTVEIIKEQTEPINEKEVNISKCEFEFDESITDEYVKEAYFTLNGNTYKQIIVNNECDYPNEVLSEKGTLEIGVVVYKVLDQDTYEKLYNPTPDYYETWEGSLKDAENSRPITPSELEQYEQALQDGLVVVNGKIEHIDQAIEDVNEAIIEVNQAIEETNNLDLDVTREENKATIKITKKDGTEKEESVYDGIGLDFNWDETSLGVKKENEEEYQYVDLKGEVGDCEFATFDIDFDTGELIMYKTSNMLIDFELNEETGELFVVIPRMEGGV